MAVSEGAGEETYGRSPGLLPIRKALRHLWPGIPKSSMDEAGEEGEKVTVDQFIAKWFYESSETRVDLMKADLEEMIEDAKLEQWLNTDHRDCH